MGHLFQNQPHSCIYLSFIGVEKQLRAIRALPIQVPFGRFVVGKDSVKQKPAVLHCRRDSVSYPAENINVYNKRKSRKEGSMWAYKVMRWSWCSHQLSAPQVLQHLMLFNSFITNEVARTQRSWTVFMSSMNFSEFFHSTSALAFLKEISVLFFAAKPTYQRLFIFTWCWYVQFSNVY